MYYSTPDLKFGLRSTILLKKKTPTNQTKRRISSMEKNEKQVYKLKIKKPKTKQKNMKIRMHITNEDKQQNLAVFLQRDEMQQWYKLNFDKWFEKMDFLFASLHFAYIINTEGLICLSIHLPTSCNRIWFLTIILILVSPWQEFLNCGLHESNQ